MSVPNVGSVLNGWMKRRHIGFVTKTKTNHKIVQTVNFVWLYCNKQSLSPTEVARKPEQQRNWKWENICFKGLVQLRIDDVIVVDGRNYIIKSYSDWNEYGYSKYDMIEDFKGVLP